jgi:hypothetical protein
MIAPHSLEKLDAAHAGHMHVEQKATVAICTFNAEELHARSKVDDRVPLSFEQHPKGVSDRIIIVDDVDRRPASQENASTPEDLTFVLTAVPVRP